MAASARRATSGDLVNVPDTMVAELIDGELFASPRPALPHARAASVNGSALVSAFHGGGAFAGAPGDGSTAS